MQPLYFALGAGLYLVFVASVHPRTAKLKAIRSGVDFCSPPLIEKLECPTSDLPAY